MKIIRFDELTKCDLHVDAIYEAGDLNTSFANEPIHHLFPCANRGGFRTIGRGGIKKLVVLFSTGEENDWPDRIDSRTGLFTYFGDNRKPGHDLEDTKLGGNRLLATCFENLHSSHHNRSLIPPFFVFSKCVGDFRPCSVQFKGLAVPGAKGMASTDDLVAVWKKDNNDKRFQNYRSTFTILDAGVIKRAWIDDLLTGTPMTENAPKAFKSWVEKGVYTPLEAEPTHEVRSKLQQLPENELQKSILKTVYDHFKLESDKGREFEYFAAEFVRLADSRMVVDEITRAVGDGGYDAYGRYRLGMETDPVCVDFFLEAKCYNPGLWNGESASSVNVKETSRLISRIRNRQFGVLVTTSYVGDTAYREIREDGHPMVFFTGRDIAEILISKGINTPEITKEWLITRFPLETST